MQEQYTSPELKLVGKADEVVFGSLVAGTDIGDQYLAHDSEFQADQEVPALQE